jgi:glycosidase
MKKIGLVLITIMALFLLSACETNHDEDNIRDLKSEMPLYNSYYQVFVRSFADGNGDGIGDFIGLEQSLDYFVELGIEGLWLMPIHPSPSYHGYDVEDYYAVNEDFGTMEDFESFLAAANEKGIKVILDLLINHTADSHPWFQAFLEGDETYSEYFRKTTGTDERVTTTGSWGQTVWHSMGDGNYYMGTFGGYMPDLNWSNPVVVQEMVDVGLFWLEKGVHGFRLDAAMHLFGKGELPSGSPSLSETLFQLEYWRFMLKEVYPDTYIVGEIFDTSSVYQEFYTAIDSVFHFDYGNAVVSAVTNGFSRSYVEDVIKWYNRALEKSETAIQAPFLRNHDQNRLASGSEPGYPNIGNHIDRLKMAAEMLLTIPGNPFIYYGEELGMMGEKAHRAPLWDIPVRLPFLWHDERRTTWTIDEYNYNDPYNGNVLSVEDQLNDEDSLLNVYKALLNLRKETPALKYGTMTEFEGNHPGIQGFYRIFEDQTVLVIHNLSDEVLNIPELSKISIFNVFYGSIESTELGPLSTVILEVELDSE